MPSTKPSTHQAVQPWLVLAVVLVADALDLLDATLTTIAAPTIAEDLGGSASLIPWLGASYALALGSLLVVGGRLGDRYGQRRTFLIGAAGFTLASLACGLAWSPAALVIARLVQGGFGALLIPQGFALLQRAFPRDRLGSAFSFFGPVLGLASVGGPILAGAIITANIAGLGWRPMFLINIVLGVATIGLATKVLPPDRHDGKAHTAPIDWFGAVALSAAMLAVLAALILVADDDANPVLAGCLLIVGAGLGVVFVRRQQRASEPLIAPSLFRNRGFVAGLIVGVVFFAAVSGLLYVISLYLQHGLHKTAGQAALLTAPTAAGMVIATTLCFRLIARLGRRLIVIGLSITIVGAGALFFLVHTSTSEPQLPALLGSFLIIGIGLGTCFGSIFDITIGDIDPHEVGSASGSLNAVQQLSNAAGAALMSSIYLRSAASNGDRTATLLSLGVVVAVAAVSLILVRLLPHHPQADHEGGA